MGEWRFGDDPSVWSVSASCHGDGTAITYAPDFGIGIGRWRATGERTGEIILVYQYLEG